MIVNSLPRPGPALLTSMPPAVQLDETLRDGEPDAQPALRTIERLVALYEQIEHVREHLRIDAHPFHCGCRSARYPPTCASPDVDVRAVRARFAAFDKQVADHLREPDRIAVDR